MQVRASRSRLAAAAFFATFLLTLAGCKCGEEGADAVVSSQRDSRSKEECEFISGLIRGLLDELVRRSDLVIRGSCYQKTTKEVRSAWWFSLDYESRYDVIEVIHGDAVTKPDLLKKAHFKRPWHLEYDMIWFYKLEGGIPALISVGNVTGVPSGFKSEVIDAVKRIKGKR